MRKNKLNSNYKKIHFVGIGGISMSGLAKLCLNQGIGVSGSDRNKNHITEELEHLGANIFYRHQKQNIEGANLVVYTCAVGENNVEVKFARECGIQVMERADFLKTVAKQFKFVIAVAGSHGKTTTCGMISKIFEVAGKNPTVLIGGELEKNSNIRIGNKEILIVEACEYQDHFLKLDHDIGVILNVDYDHPDYFESEKKYENSFQKFAKNSKKISIIEEKCKILINNNCLTFGNNGNYQAKRISQNENYIKFDVYKNNDFFENIKIETIGVYNAKNALCAIAVADYFGIEKKYIKLGLQKFQAVKRRYEYMGKLGDNIVITDYAHHPTQIENCIKATRAIYSRNITVVFEPHTYSRTKFLFNDFVRAISLADNIVLLPTYSARENPIDGGSSKDLFRTLKFNKQQVIYCSNYKKCLKELEKLDNNIILILGAGSIINLAEEIKKNYINSVNKNQND